MTQLRYKCALFSSARRYVCAFVRPVGFAAGRFFAAKKGHVFVFCHERVFPVNLKKQLSSVYLYTFFSTFTITDAVWVALLAARGFTLAQIGLAEGIFHAVSLLCEVLSDRRATLISVDSMAYSLLMIPASPVLGWLGDVTGQAGAGLCVLGGAVLLSGLAVAGKTRYNGGRAG